MSPAKIQLEVITSGDCLVCRQCCHFDPAYLDYAPLFTTAQRDRIERELAGEEIAFTPYGQMWRIVLHERPERHVCPLLEERTGRCRVYTHAIFDCDTWPYEISRRGDRLLLTLAAGCPAADVRKEAMRVRGLELLPRMLAWVDRYPECIQPYHDSVTVLAELGSGGPKSELLAEPPPEARRPLAGSPDK